MIARATPAARCGGSAMRARSSRLLAESHRFAGGRRGCSTDSCSTASVPSAAPTRFPVHTGGTRSAGSRAAQTRASSPRCSIISWPEMREEGARRRGPPPLPRSQSDLQLLREARGAARSRRVARLTLREARQLIVATDGVLMLLDESDGTLETDRRIRRRAAEPAGFRHGRWYRRRRCRAGVGRNRQRRGCRSAAHHRAITTVQGADLLRRSKSASASSASSRSAARCRWPTRRRN